MQHVVQIIFIIRPFDVEIHELSKFEINIILENVKLYGAYFKIM
jgi:hypothetical protein